MILDLVRSMRPHQWTKNFFIFAGLVFSQSLFHIPILLKTVFAFFAFCLLTSGVYIINDLIDMREDRVHPIKGTRPIASGRVSLSMALSTGLLLVVGSLLLSFVLNVGFGFISLMTPHILYAL